MRNVANLQFFLFYFSDSQAWRQHLDLSPSNQSRLGICKRIVVTFRNLYSSKLFTIIIIDNH